MAYATRSDLEDHLGELRYLELVDRDSDGTPDVAQVDAALERASSLVDSYIARYLPIPTPYPRVVVDCVVQITTYDLAGNRATETERLRYEDALRWLRDLAAGTATLGLPEGPIVVEGEALVSADRAQWTRSRAGGLF